jgi:hypothetical protein
MSVKKTRACEEEFYIAAKNNYAGAAVTAIKHSIAREDGKITGLEDDKTARCLIFMIQRRHTELDPHFLKRNFISSDESKSIQTFIKSDLFKTFEAKFLEDEKIVLNEDAEDYTEGTRGYGFNAASERSPGFTSGRMGARASSIVGTPGVTPHQLGRRASDAPPSSASDARTLIKTSVAKERAIGGGERRKRIFSAEAIPSDVVAPTSVKQAAVVEKCCVVQ